MCGKKTEWLILIRKSSHHLDLKKKKYLLICTCFYQDGNHVPSYVRFFLAEELLYVVTWTSTPVELSPNNRQRVKKTERISIYDNLLSRSSVDMNTIWKPLIKNIKTNFTTLIQILGSWLQNSTIGFSEWIKVLDKIFLVPRQLWIQYLC